MKQVNVPTPNGPRKHGFIDGDRFIRYLKPSDLMRIFGGAWSMHPAVFADLENLGVKTLEYHCDNVIYTMSVEKARKVGFAKTFSGGQTVYLRIKHWDYENKSEQAGENKDAGQSVGVGDKKQSQLPL